MINGLMPKLRLMTIEGFIMAIIKKSVDFDNERCARFVRTAVSSDERHSAYHDIDILVYNGRVDICGSSSITMTTDEAIKLFAGLLEDIKNAGGVE